MDVKKGNNIVYAISLGSYHIGWNFCCYAKNVSDFRKKENIVGVSICMFNH